jgi:flavin-dependent dehydrogenase
MTQQHYDFVVAGGGPAGSVTAIALANRGARSGTRGSCRAGASADVPFYT